MWSIWHYAVIAILVLPLLAWAYRASRPIDETKVAEQHAPDIAAAAFVLRLAALFAGFVALLSFSWNGQVAKAIGGALVPLVGAAVLFLVVWTFTRLFRRRLTQPRRKAFELMLFVFGLCVVFSILDMKMAQIRTADVWPNDLSSGQAEPKKAEAGSIQQAAEQGDAEAQFKLGQRHDKGEGVPKDLAKALEWYRKAADQGHFAANWDLAQKYKVGDGVTVDAAKAEEFFRRAATPLRMKAEQGDAESQFLLAILYNNGEGGLPQDHKLAAGWLLRAARTGYPDADWLLGDYHLNGAGVPKDVGKAIEFYQKAGEAGAVHAQVALAQLYTAGVDVPKDMQRASEWLRKAATAGHTDSQRMLAELYMGDHGFPKDLTLALAWYQKAAPSGDLWSQWNLGWAYFNGDGMPKDVVLGYAWMNLASASGWSHATYQRDNFEKKMRVTELAEAQLLSSSWKQGTLLTRGGLTPVATSGAAEHSKSIQKVASGTMFAVSIDGHGVTNRHVIAGCKEIRVQGNASAVTVIASDSPNDLALLKLPTPVLAAAHLVDDPSNVRQGEEIVVYGFPLDSLLSSGGNLTPGVVSALTGLGNNTNQLQITAPVQPGSSGSPVINKKGEVIGVVSQKLSDAVLAKATGSVGQNVNFAVNGHTLRAFLSANHVNFKSGAGFFAGDKSAAALADDARRWTRIVECWK